MKSRIFAVIIFFLLALPFGVIAQDSKRAPQNVVLPAGQTINGNYFAAGESVRIDGTVNGDAYVAGGTVTVNGRINGDLLAAGGTVTVRGPVTQDVRVAGGTVTLAGDIGRNVTAGAGTFTLERGARIAGSLVSGGGTVTLMAPVAQDATIAGGTILLASQIGQNAQLYAETIDLSSNAVVSGNLSYTSEKEASIEQGASVSGQVKRSQPAKEERKQNSETSFAAGFIIGKIISLISLFLIGYIFLRLFPRTTGRIVETAQKNIWKSAGIGALLLFGAPIIMVLLFSTVIGIPFAIALLFCYILTLYISKLFVVIGIGHWAAKKAGKTISDSWALFVGLLIHLFITIIPVIGWLAGFFIMVWGAGAITLTKHHLYQRYRKKDLL